MKKILLITLILGFNFLMSQKVDGICQSTSKFGLDIEKMSFNVYKNNTFINDKYRTVDEITNLTPEELLRSQFSTTNNKWLSINYNKPMSWSQQQFDKLNNPKNKMELLCKLYIKSKDFEFSIVKINFYDEKNNVVSGSILMQKNKNNKWFITNNEIFSNIEFVIMFTSLDDLYYIFNNSPKSSNTGINNLINKVWANNYLNFNKAINNLGGLLIKSEYKSFPYEKSIVIQRDVEINILTKDNIPFIKQDFCYFFENEVSEYHNDDLTLVLNKVKPQFVDSKIVPLYFLRYINLNGDNCYYLKFINYKSDNKSLEEISFIENSNNLKQEIDNQNVFEIFKKDIDNIKNYFITTSGK